MAFYSHTSGSSFKVTSNGTVAVGDSAWNPAGAPDNALNTTIGYGAGSDNVSGIGNTIIGYASNIGETTGGATVIGAGAALQVANATTTSVALGYMASSSNNNVCTIGAQTDNITVVEYGPHFGFYDTILYWQGYTWDGSSFTVTAPMVLSGLLVFYSLEATPAPNHTVTVTSAATVIGSIPDCRVGSAWYFKVGVYASTASTNYLTLTFGTGWTVRGNPAPQRIPRITTKTNGSVTYLCTVTNATPGAEAITVICPSGPTT